MTTKRFTIEAQKDREVRYCTKNEAQTLELFNKMFNGDFRYKQLLLYVKTMELNSEPFITLSPFGHISITRVR